MPLNVPVEQEIAPTGVNLPRAPQLADSGLGAIAQGTGVAAEQLAAIEHERLRKYNASMILGAEQKLHDQYRVESGRLKEARRGSASKNVTNDIASWWEEEAPKISAELENDVQREMFYEHVAQARGASLDEFSVFEAAEITRGAVQQGEATVTRGIDRASADYANPSSVKLGRMEVDKGLATQRDALKWEDDEYVRQKDAATTQFHTEIIENMAEQDPAAAAAYFAANKDEINGSVHDQLQNKLKSATDIRVAQDAADDIWGRKLTRAQALELAGKELEGASREQAQALLRTRYAEQEQDVADAEQARLDQLRVKYQNGRYEDFTPSEINFLARTSPGELERFRSTSPQERVKTNWEVRDSLMWTAQNEPADFARVDLDRFSDKLNAEELNELKKIKADIVAGIQSPTATLAQMLSDATDNWDPDQRDETGQFNAHVRNEIRAAQQTKGGELTQKEMQEIVDHRVLSITVNDPWFGAATRKRQYQMTPEDYEEAFGEVPSTDQQAIADKLRASGLPVTKQAIVDVYNKANQ